LARLVRANTFAAYENINLWHERDISHSSVERVIIPDSTAACDYMLRKMAQVVKGLTVNEKNMLRNIELNRGLIYSQKILLKLMEHGLGRIEAYDIVQAISLRVINNNSSFKEETIKDSRVRKYFSAKEIGDFFDPYIYLRNIGKIYKRTGL
jgi:adenylosuccinate lyase